MPTQADLTVVLTAHDETLVSGPTIAAAEASIAAAEAAGFTVERIVALDRPTDATRAYFMQDRLSHWDRRELDEGDLGRVRNRIVPETAGRWIAFLDADDLFSPGWLREGARRLKALEDRGIRAIAHPELNWLFDGAHSVYAKPDQDDPLFLPQHFWFSNYYDSLCMAPREAHLEHPYAPRDIPGGLSFQDWQFSIETMAAGWMHVHAPDTIIFKRRRDASLVSESRARRALVRFHPMMRIDRVAGLAGTARRARVADAPPVMPNGEVPGYGPTLAARIDRACALRWRRFAGRKVYDRVKAEFDHAYYLTRYPDIRALEEVDPVAHYLRAGHREGRDPTPWFGTRAYLDRYPDVEESGQNPFFHYLTKGRDQGRIAAPFSGLADLAEALGMTEAEAEVAWRHRHDSMRSRLEHGELGAEVAAAARFEPLIEQGWPDALAVRIPPLHRDDVSARTAAMLRLCRAAHDRPARFVICVNRARYGRARRVEGHLAHALAAAHGAEEVVLVTTDAPGALPKGKVPPGVRHVDFAALVPDFKGDTRQRVLAEFLRIVGAEAMFNVNSRLAWDMMAPYGTALGASMRLYAGLLCNERTDAGFATGYPLRRVYRHFEQFAALFCDSTALADEIRERHMIPPEQAGRVTVLPNPVDPSIPLAPRPRRNPRPQVFWAGRLDAQKRVDLAFAVARALPHIDLHMWGEAVMGAAPLPDPPPNVTLHGSYDRFGDLPLGTCDAWLYTSGWDGVPTILLEVAMTGIPIVGTLVGGTGEVLRAGMSRPVPLADGAAGLAAALAEVLADPESARQGALALRETLVAERTDEAHAAALAQLLATGRADTAAATPLSDPEEPAIALAGAVRGSAP